MRQRLTVEAYTEGILSGDRIILSRAITLIESRLKNDRILAKKYWKIFFRLPANH